MIKYFFELYWLIQTVIFCLTESTSIYSEILRYNHKESRYLSFQKILTHGAKDIQFFSVTAGRREENYLAIANHVQMGTYFNYLYLLIHEFLVQ